MWCLLPCAFCRGWLSCSVGLIWSSLEQWAKCRRENLMFAAVCFLPWMAQLLSWVDWSSEPSFEEKMWCLLPCALSRGWLSCSAGLIGSVSQVFSFFFFVLWWSREFWRRQKILWHDDACIWAKGCGCCEYSLGELLRTIVARLNEFPSKLFLFVVSSLRSLPLHTLIIHFLSLSFLFPFLSLPFLFFLLLFYIFSVFISFFPFYLVFFLSWLRTKVATRSTKTISFTSFCCFLLLLWLTKRVSAYRAFSTRLGLLDMQLCPVKALNACDSCVSAVRAGHGKQLSMQVSIYWSSLIRVIYVCVCVCAPVQALFQPMPLVLHVFLCHGCFSANEHCDEGECGKCAVADRTKIHSVHSASCGWRRCQQMCSQLVKR